MLLSWWFFFSLLLIFWGESKVKSSFRFSWMGGILDFLGRSSQDVMHYLENLADKRPMFAKKTKNRFLDMTSKRCALKASPFVVALVSYTGDKELNQGCGAIIETHGSNSSFVLTSANLLRRLIEKEDSITADNYVADNLKVVVNVSDGKSYEGELCCYDFHYNLAVIKFKSASPIVSATIRRVDDSLELNPSQCFGSVQTSSLLRPHSDLVTLVPGDPVVVVGRYFAKPYNLMAAPGRYR